MGIVQVFDQTKYNFDSLDGFSDFIIYGAGNTGRDVCSFIKSNLDGKVLTFVDVRADKEYSIEGIPVCQLENVKIPKAIKDGALVIVAIFNRDVNLAPIVDNLHRTGFKNVISYVQFHRFFPNQLGNKYWLGDINIYKRHEAQIQETIDLLADDESRRIFKSILCYRASGDSEELTQPEGLDTQYFSKTIPSSKKSLRFIDGGAYDGDTLVAMIKLGIFCEAVASFEPDLENFAKLTTFSMANRSNIANENYLFPCAVWSKTEYLKFNSDSKEASNIDVNGSETVLGVSIDNLIPDFRPNFIKMDIEGAEIDGLMGSKETIKTFRPSLGICIYHTPEHLWEIPLLIKSFDLDYKFYVRAHGHNGFDLVLYAIPSKLP
ncbi:MAG: FkbM family methyltransferase [Cyclobacteriaceae bacterium]